MLTCSASSLSLSLPARYAAQEEGIAMRVERLRAMLNGREGAKLVLVTISPKRTCCMSVTMPCPLDCRFLVLLA